MYAFRNLRDTLWIWGLLVAAAASPGTLLAEYPHLAGKVTLDPGQGLLSANVCLSRLPRQNEISFVLHRGLNIREVAAGDDAAVSFEGYYDGEFEGEGVVYRFSVEGGRDGFCVAYTGAFPVYRVDQGERNFTDWKGNLAFNGRSVRATEQTKWYPVLFQPESEALSAFVTYDLQVECASCRTIYLNGAVAVAGPSARLASEVPRPLVLFAGDFDTAEVDGVHFVNGAVSQQSGEAILRSVRKIATFFESLTGVSYQGRPAFLTFASVSRTRHLDRTTWGFNAWPTLAFDGRLDFNALVGSGSSGMELQPDHLAGLSHEMAHYYFGTVLVPRGPYSWFLIESTAEYLALRAIEEFQGREAVESRLASYAREVAEDPPKVRFDRLQQRHQWGDGERYVLGPLLLFALEDLAGRDSVERFLAGLLQQPPGEEFYYHQFQARFLEAGASQAIMDRFQEDCLARPVEEGCLSRFRQ